MAEYHLDLLREELIRRRRANPRYSLRSFARFLDVNPGSLSRVMAQKRRMAVSTAEKIADRLKLDRRTRKAFLGAVRSTIKSGLLSHARHCDPSGADAQIDADFLRMITESSDKTVSCLLDTLECADTHHQHVGVTGSVSHAPVRAGECTILTIYGVVGARFEYKWTTKHGTIFGKGMRVNFQPFREFIGNATVDFAVVAHGTVMLSHQFSIPVIEPRPRIKNVQVKPAGDGRIRVQGQVDGSRAIPWDELCIRVYPHTIGEGSGLPSTLALNQTGNFDDTMVHRPSTDKIILQLARRDSSIESSEHLFTDYHYYTKAHLPFRINDTDSFAFALHDFRSIQHHPDKQISSLLSRFFRASLCESSEACLLQSFKTLDLAFVYDQALSVLAFCHAGEKQAAARILTALDLLQIKQPGDFLGAWRTSYVASGKKLNYQVVLCDTKEEAQPQDVTHRIRAGNVAWVILALVQFQRRFNDASFQPMLERALHYLMGQSTPTSFLGANSVCIPLLPPVGNNDPRAVSLQQNIVSYAAFRNAAQLLGNDNYRQHGDSVREFVECMWDSNLGGFYTGYYAGSSAPNLSDAHMDPQSLVLLALHESPSKMATYQRGLQRIFNLFFEPAGYLAEEHRAIPGFFDWRPMNSMLPNLSRQFVWCEGTLAVILAMRLAEEHSDEPVSFVRYGQTYTADSLLASMNGFTDETGAVPYCTENAIRDDFLAEPSLVGTAWLYFANHNINPLDI